MLAGKYPSVRAASIAAGLTKERSALQELKNAWNKATRSEKETFTKWVNASLWKAGPSSPSLRHRWCAPVPVGGALISGAEFE